MHRVVWLAAIAVFATAVWAAGSSEERAAAQSAGITELETVTVTATKTERPAHEVPGSVSVITTEDIELEQPQSVDDLLQDLPNVELFSGPRRIGEEANIRGFSDERMVTTLDGARQNFSVGHQGGFLLEPDLLKQIEVYRGPNSALYGSGSLGGVIALTTKDASDFLDSGRALGARLKGGFQSVNEEWLGSLAAFGRIGTSLEYLGNFSYRDSDDIELARDETLSDSAERSLAGLGKVLYRPWDHHQLRASVDLFHSDGDLPTNPESAGSTMNEVADTDIDRRTYTVAYRYDDPANPRAETAFTAYRTELEEDLRRLRIGIQTATEFDTTGFDLRNNTRLSLGGEALEQVFTNGVEYFKDEQEGTQNGQPHGSFPAAEADVWGFYLQDEILFFKRVSLIPGFPDPALRPFFLKRAARWQGRALGSSRVFNLLSPHLVSTETPVLRGRALGGAMLHVIEHVLTAAHLAEIRACFERTRFVDGRVTAGELAAQAKHNLQLPEQAPETQELARLVMQALQKNSAFFVAALPRSVYPPLFNRYVPGVDFEIHVDNAIRIGHLTLRTDISGTLFLSSPEEYQGGALVIADTYGTQRLKLKAGSAVLYPSTSLHKVEPVISGVRDVAVFWVQSLVREDSKRGLLHQLDRAIQDLRARAPESPEIAPLISCYHNLLRMWAEL